MPKKNHLAVLATAVLLLFTVIACKKDKDKSTQELLLGKWIFQSNVYHEFDAGSNYYDTTDLSASGYFLEFKSNGKLIINYGGLDTVDYSILSNQSIEFDGDTIQMPTLTENQLTILFKDIYDADYYEEDIYHLTK